MARCAATLHRIEQYIRFEDLPMTSRPHQAHAMTRLVWLAPRVFDGGGIKAATSSNRSAGVSVSAPSTVIVRPWFLSVTNMP